MKSCPYCKKEINVNWSYCHHCNKPLLVNLNKEIGKQIPQSRDINSYFIYDKDPSISSPLPQPYDLETIGEDDFSLKIQKIDKRIQQRVIFGESIGSLQLEKANLYYQKRDLASSLKTLESAVNLFTDDSDLLNTAISYNEMGLIYDEMGFFDDALNRFEQAIEILKDLPEHKLIIQIYNNLANVYHHLENLEKSYEYYDKALKLAERENFALEEIKTSSNLVELLFLLKEYGKIERILKRNLEYFRYTDDNYGVIISLTKMGKLYYFMGESRYKQANQSLKDSLDLITKIGTYDLLMKAKLKWECYLYLGKLALAQNNFELAEEYLDKSLETIRILEEKNINECLILEPLAHLHEFNGGYTKAIKYYKICKDSYQKFGNDVRIAELKYKIAHIYLENIKDESEAIKFYEEALEIFEDLNYSRESAEILHKLGDIYLNREIIELALEYFEKAKEFYQEYQDEYNLNLIMSKINSLIKE
jgi:tetratricopeptide (TPR) repeat protein